MHLTGNISDYFIVYWAGVLVSFTPCVYPLLPITAGFIAGMNTKGTKLGGFVISLFYVLGIAITYSALAVIAALSGKIFGQFQQHPLIFAVVSIILFVFALAMFDVFSLPTLGLALHHKLKGKGLGAVIVFGIASGLVIGPCTAPVLGTLLLYISSKQNIPHALTLMFIFAYGVGTSVIIVGTFSGILANLPKSGVWLKRIKQLCGLILLGAAVYFICKTITLIN